MVMLVTRKSPNILQRRESFLHPLNRLCRRLSKLAQSDMHAVLSLQTQGGLHLVACVGPACTDSEPPSAALRHQILAPIHRTCSRGVCDLRRPAYPRRRSRSG